MELEILDSRGDRSLVVYKDIPPNFSIEQLKQRFAKSKPKFYEDRQSFRLEPRGRMLKDSDTLQSLGISRSGPAKLYFKDLGPQIGWTTVFFCEYAGPLLVYLIFYTRPALIYANSQSKPHWVVQVAMLCWCGHYLKRIFETLFVHRFSHGTMPLRNLFKNCGYYWGFAAYVAYYTNHPLYTPPIYGDVQIWSALGVFLFSELGNFSIHLALRNLRPAGSKERRIPFPTANPFTWLFSLVSCPNYTYEVMSWLGFTAMTQCIPAGLFALAGFYQMAVWALGKHRNYKREFPNYPRRKAIIPFLL